jgi:hypothetical protein
MLARLLITALATLSTFADASVSVKDCAATFSLFKVTSLSVAPVNPASGDPFDLHMEWTVPEGVTVADGTAKYSVTLNYIPFSPSVEPLCQDIPCPMGPGSYTNTTTSTWPSGVTGSLTTKMEWLDPAGSTLACVAISGTVSTVNLDPNATQLVQELPPNQTVVRSLRGGVAF